MNLRPEAAPTFPRQPIPSLPYLLGGCSRRRSTSSIHGVVHPCSRLPPGEGGPKDQVRERPPGSGVQFVATARPGGLSPSHRSRCRYARCLQKDECREAHGCAGAAVTSSYPNPSQSAKQKRPALAGLFCLAGGLGFYSTNAKSLIIYRPSLVA